jgi:mycothiol system anti-sigma-R factor
VVTYDDPGSSLDPVSDQCAAVLRDVWSFLDDELDPQRRAVVEQHLDGCSPCLEAAGLDHQLKQLLHSKCGGERAPAHLRSRLAAQLQTLTVTSVSGPGGTTTTVTRTTTAVAAVSGEVSAATSDGSGAPETLDEDAAAAAAVVQERLRARR